MDNKLEYILNVIKEKNPMHFKKLKKDFSKCDDNFFLRANFFLNKYNSLLENNSQNLEFAIDCYLKLVEDVKNETENFIITGEYSNKSFKEVNAKVYKNPHIMEYYLHGLLLAQFLWIQNYKMLIFFIESLNNCNNLKKYLEIGGGHGLYVSEALIFFDAEKTDYEFVDVSLSSIELAKKMITNDSVSYIHCDIFDFFPNYGYDYITMGEVLEHVEEPLKLLKKIFSLLNQGGKFFLTTPANAPMIDHIYLFNNVDDIRKIILDAGFIIQSELYAYAEDVSSEVAERFKIPLRYAAILSK